MLARCHRRCCSCMHDTAAVAAMSASFVATVLVVIQELAADEEGSASGALHAAMILAIAAAVGSYLGWVGVGNAKVCQTSAVVSVWAFAAVVGYRSADVHACEARCEHSNINHAVCIPYDLQVAFGCVAVAAQIVIAVLYQKVIVAAMWQARQARMPQPPQADACGRVGQGDHVDMTDTATNTSNDI